MLGMIDYFEISVADLDASVQFYDAALMPVGIRRQRGRDSVVYSNGAKPEFWICDAGRHPTPNRACTISFTAEDKATVQAFFDAAVAAGAQVQHAPHEWPIEQPTYFAAFVSDPDGNTVLATFDY